MKAKCEFCNYTEESAEALLMFNMYFGLLGTAYIECHINDTDGENNTGIEGMKGPRLQAIARIDNYCNGAYAEVKGDVVFRYCPICGRKLIQRRKKGE